MRHAPSPRRRARCCRGSESMSQSCPGVDDHEGLVVVVGVVQLFLATGDESPRATVGAAGRLDRVLAVVTGGLRRQQLLPIAEGRAVLVGVRERPTAFDELPRLLHLGGEVGQRDHLEAGFRAGQATSPALTFLAPGELPHAPPAECEQEEPGQRPTDTPAREHARLPRNPGGHAGPAATPPRPHACHARDAEASWRNPHRTGAATSDRRTAAAVRPRPARTGQGTTAARARARTRPTSGQLRRTHDEGTAGRLAPCSPSMPTKPMPTTRWPRSSWASAPTPRCPRVGSRSTSRPPV